MTINSSSSDLSTSHFISCQPSPYTNSHYSILKPETQQKTEFTRGTSLSLSTSEPSSQSSVGDFNLARNIFPESSQESFSSNSTQNLGELQPTYSMLKIGLSRKIIKPKKKNTNRRYPARTKISPIRWWIGERAVYNDDGFLIAKDIRR